MATAISLPKQRFAFTVQRFAFNIHRFAFIIQKNMKTVKLILVQLFVILIAIEIVFRIFGYQPYRVQPYSLVSEPAQCLLPDEKLGFILNEGKFDVTINDSVKYSVTHDAGGERITDFIIKKGGNQLPPCLFSMIKYSVLLYIFINAL